MSLVDNDGYFYFADGDNIALSHSGITMYNSSDTIAWLGDDKGQPLTWEGPDIWLDAAESPQKTFDSCDYCGNRLLDEDRKCMYCGAPR